MDKPANTENDEALWKLFHELNWKDDDERRVAVIRSPQPVASETITRNTDQEDSRPRTPLDRVGEAIRGFARGVLERRHHLFLIIALASLATGIYLAHLVLLPPNLNDLREGYDKDERIAFITAYRNSDKKIEDTENITYTISLIPTNVENVIFVSISTNLVSSPDISYQVEWPGKVRIQEFSDQEYDNDPNISSDVIGARVTGQHDNKTEISVRSNTSYYESNDYFMFYWLDGGEKISFSDSRIRLKFLATGRKSSTVVKVGMTGEQQFIEESPPASDMAPNIEFGGIDHFYRGTNGVIVTYTDINRKNLSQYFLIASGIFIGLSTSMFTQWLAEVLNKISV
jgi:hypothetical protein